MSGAGGHRFVYVGNPDGESLQAPLIFLRIAQPRITKMDELNLLTADQSDDDPPLDALSAHDGIQSWAGDPLIRQDFVAEYACVELKRGVDINRMDDHMRPVTHSDRSRHVHVLSE